MAQNESKSVDLNVRIIEAVECCPLLYKGHATIEERQAVWQQISEQLCVSESVLKSRWHILCGYYQRSLEKRRSTDEEENGDDGTARSDFRYEKEMAFMMPYMHARIAIAAANAARKQQELAAAGNKELTDPEFIITEKDLEDATRINNNLSEEYIFYDVETLDGDVEHYQEHNVDSNSNVESNEDDEQSQDQHHEINEVIEEVDESGNIVVQDLIIEGGELIGEDGEQIVVEEDDLLQMDDQIETVIEEVVEHTPSLEHTHVEMETPQEEMVTQTVVLQNQGSRRILRVEAKRNGHKFAKIVQEMKTELDAETEMETSNSAHEIALKEEQQNEQKIVQSTPSFAQEYAIMTRRRRAVVLKATPRVQVELTDHTAANVSSMEIHEEIEDAALDVGAHAVVVGDNNDESKTNIKAIITNDNSIRRHQQKWLHERHGGVNSNDSSSDHDNRSNDSNVVTTTAAENEEYQTSKGERSEDTIFGELVTAMLKHMPQERKRAIKKSIMDLLLT